MNDYLISFNTDSWRMRCCVVDLKICVSSYQVRWCVFSVATRSFPSWKHILGNLLYSVSLLEGIKQRFDISKLYPLGKDMFLWLLISTLIVGTRIANAINLNVYSATLTREGLVESE